MPLEVRFHNTALSICQLPQGSDAPVGILSHPFAAFFRTHNEVTLICPTEKSGRQMAKFRQPV